METIRINIEVNLSESTQQFIKSIMNCACKGKAAEPTNEPVAPINVTKEPKPMAKPTAKPVAPVEPEPVAEPAPGVPAAQDASSVTYSIEEVRNALAKKINEHRAEIKQKLNELGSPSVTKLDPSKYTEMYNFLESL